MLHPREENFREIALNTPTVCLKVLQKQTSYSNQPFQRSYTSYRKTLLLILKYIVDTNLNYCKSILYYDPGFNRGVVYCLNRYIIIWMLHKIFMYSDKVILVLAEITILPIHLLYSTYTSFTPHTPPLLHPFPSYWRNKLTNK